MSAPLVSVVVVNYNYGRFLPQAIDSVLAQSYPEIELLVVDDGSTDDSLDVVRAYGPRVRLIRQANGGVSAARNHGIRQSRGALVAFLDADDVWTTEKIAKQVARFERKTVGMAACGLGLIDASGRSLGVMPVEPGAPGLEDLALLRAPGVPGAGSSGVVRRSVLDEVGGFDEALSTSADWDLCRRIACRWEIEVVAEPLVLYRQHGSAMHRKVDVQERDMLRAFDSMFRDPAARAIHPLRNRCYGNLYWMLAGSYFHAGSPAKGLKYLFRALAAWPPSAGRLLQAPLRRVAQRLS
jgi:glycosyltransferase involved in cell wall biosynthesis